MRQNTEMLSREEQTGLLLKIQSLYGLKEQARELLHSLAEMVDSHYTALFFQDAGGGFSFLSGYPESGGKLPRNLRFNDDDVCIKEIRESGKAITVSEILALTKGENDGERLAGIEVLVPVLSRGKLTGVLAAGEKRSGDYSRAEIEFLTQVMASAATALEKEFLMEQSRAREQEITTLYELSLIIATSLNIPSIFDEFIIRLKEVCDVYLAAIITTTKGKPEILAISSGDKTREQQFLKMTASDWLTDKTGPDSESSIPEEIRIISAGADTGRKIKSVIYLPLIVNSVTIGNLILTSLQPDAYTTRQISFFENLAHILALQINNSRTFAEVEEKSRIDELTGLMNRRYMDETINNEIDRDARYGGIFSLIIFDLDNLKFINDTYGHIIGDEFLKKTGAITSQTIRKSDQGFRYGGDEIAVILPNTPLENAGTVAERLREQIQSIVIGEPGLVTASFGISSWPKHGNTINDIIDAADRALYTAKNSGGNDIRTA